MALPKFSNKPRSRVHAPLPAKDEITVKQEFKKEVDINQIISKMKQGISPPSWMTRNTPHYGDFSEMPASLTEAYAIVSRAEEAFMSLPVEFRRAIDHDPRNLDSAPKELFEQFGLLKKEPESERPTDVPATGSHKSPKATQSPKKNPPPSAENDDE